MAPEEGTTTLFNHLVSDMQSDVSIEDDTIFGTLKYIEGGLAESGPLAGDGHFLALKFSCEDWDKYDDVKVGLNPSAGTGLVSIKSDPDKNGVFKIAEEDSEYYPQNFVVQTEIGDVIKQDVYATYFGLEPKPNTSPVLKISTVDADVQCVEDVYSYDTIVGDVFNWCDIICNTGFEITSITVDGTSLVIPEPDDGYYEFTDIQTDPREGVVLALTVSNGTDTYNYSVTYTYNGNALVESIELIGANSVTAKADYVGAVTYRQEDAEGATSPATFNIKVSNNTNYVVTGITINNVAQSVPEPSSRVYTLSNVTIVEDDRNTIQVVATDGDKTETYEALFMTGV